MNSEELQKTASLVEAIKEYGGMGNGERDNAMREVAEQQAAGEFVSMGEALRPFLAKPDLCVCGTKTRAEQGCECGPDGPDTESVLREADRLVDSHRGPEYGHPLLDFGKVTGMALALWGRGPETPEEHALYCILIKLARLQATPGHHDSIVDIAGYIKTYSMVIDERVKRLTDKG